MNAFNALKDIFLTIILKNAKELVPTSFFQIKLALSVKSSHLAATPIPVKLEIIAQSTAENAITSHMKEYVQIAQPL
jgi:hypothetical protein